MGRKHLPFQVISERYGPWILDDGIVEADELALPFAAQLEKVRFSSLGIVQVGVLVFLFVAPS